MDAIYGMTMEKLAEVMTKHGELRAKLGEPYFMAEFDRYLATEGFDQNTWALAHNAWHDRWKADPTGRAEAQFHMLLAQGTAKAHFGDVRDMSQDTQEGITLDQYAQIVVAISRAGANADEVVKQFGLQDVAHWQRANAAWTQEMGKDTTHKLTMQYGQLYSKYAGPQFQEEMVSQTAAILADHNKPRDVVRDDREELTPDLFLQKMQSSSRQDRWRYAGLYAHMADLGNVPDKAWAIATVTPILIEMVEQHDEHTTSDAENGVRKAWDLGVRSDDLRGACMRCLNRAQEKLTSLQAAFAPIQDQAVPERITLQARIQDYQSLINTMNEYLSQDWTPVGAPAFAQQGQRFDQGFAQPGFGAGAPMPFAPPRSGGFPKWILAPVLILGGCGLFYAVKGRAMLAERAANAAASSASAAASSALSSANASAASSASAPAAATPAAHAAAPAASASAAGSAAKAKTPPKKK